MLKRTVVLIAVVLAMAALLPASSTLASPPLTRINNVTFSSPVRLPGNTLLTPGKYTFEAGPQGVSLDASPSLGAAPGRECPASPLV